MEFIVESHGFRSIHSAQNVQDDLRFVREKIPDVVHKNAVALAQVFAIHRGRGKWAASIGEVEAARRLFGVALDCGRETFRLLGHQEEIEVFIDGRSFRARGIPPRYDTNVRTWCEVAFLAFALGSPASLDSLSEVSLRRLRALAGESEPFFEPLGELLKLLHAGSFEAEQRDLLLAEAEAISEPIALREMGPSESRIYRSLLPVIRALQERDQDAYTESLFAALEAHKAYWGRGTRAEDVEGTLALPAAAMAVLGRREGLRLELRSGYLPEWLVGAPS